MKLYLEALEGVQVRDSEIEKRMWIWGDFGGGGIIMYLRVIACGKERGSESDLDFLIWRD